MAALKTSKQSLQKTRQKMQDILSTINTDFPQQFEYADTLSRHCPAKFDHTIPLQRKTRHHLNPAGKYDHEQSDRFLSSRFLRADEVDLKVAE